MKLDETGIQKTQTYTYNLQPFKLAQIFNDSGHTLPVASRQVTISEPLQFDHYGGLEYAAEVALLSRTIRFQGPGGGDSPQNLWRKMLKVPWFWQNSPGFCLRHEKIIFKLEWFIVISCILSDTLLCFWMVYWVLLCAQSKSQSAVGHVLPSIFRGFCNYEGVWPFVVYKPLRGRQPWRPQEMIAVSRVAMEDTWCVFLAPNVKLLAFWHTAWGKRMSWAGTVQDPKLPVGVKWTTWPKVKIHEHIAYSTCKVCRPKSFGLYLGYS